MRYSWTERSTVMALAAILTVCCVAIVPGQDAAAPDLPPAIYVPYDKSVEAGLAGKGVYLPYQQFVKLWDASCAKVPAAQEPPIGAVITGYTLEGAVKGDYALLTLRGSASALAKGWSSVRLPLDLTITRFAAEDPRAALERGDDALILHLPSAGSYPFTAEVAVPVVHDALGKRSLALNLPAAPAGRLDLFIPDTDADVTVSPAVASTTIKVSGGTRMLCVLGGAHALTVAWQPPVAAAAAEALLLTTEDVVATVGERSVRYQISIGATILRRPMDTLSVVIPPGTQVLSVEAPGLRTWDRNESRLVLHLQEAIQGEVKVIITLEQLLAALHPGESRQVLASIPSVLSAARSTGSLVLNTDGQGEGIVVIVDGHEGLSQVDPSELGAPAALAAFRFLAVPAPIPLTVTRSQPELRAEIDQLIHLGLDEDVIEVEVRVDVRKAGVFALAFDVPASWELAEASGNPVAIDDSRLSPVQNGARQLDLSLRSRLLGPGTVSLRFRASPSIPSSSAAIDLGRLSMLRLRGGREQRGSLLIAAPRSWSLESSAREGLAGGDSERLKREGALAGKIAALKEEEDIDLAFTYVAADPSSSLSAIVKARPRPREMVLREEDLVIVAEGSVRRQISWHGDVRYSALPALRVQAPSLFDGQLVFKGSGLAERSVVSREDGVSTWELRFQAPVLGAFTITAEQVHPLPPLASGQTGSLALSPVLALDASRMSRTIAIAREGTLEVTATAPGMDPLVASDLPTALQGQGTIAGFQGNDPATVQLRFVRHDLIPLADAAISVAHYQAVVGDDGISRVRCQLILASRGRPFLELHLPNKSELLEVAVDGRQTHPSRRDDGSIVVPLPQVMGLATQLVAFVYEQTRPSGGLGSHGHLHLNLPGFGDDVQTRPLPVESVELELYLPDGVEPLWWGGDVHLQGSPTGLWATLLQAMTDTSNQVSSQPRLTDDGLTVKIALMGTRYDLARLGGGGGIAVTYLASTLIRLMTLMLLVAGAFAAYRAARHRYVLTCLGLVALLAALLSTGAWRMPAYGVAVGIGAALIAVAAVVVRQRRQVWRASSRVPDDDPWLSPPDVSSLIGREPPAATDGGEPQAPSDQPPTEPRP